MNLVCFSSLTAGALVCNLLNNRFVDIKESVVSSREHAVFKIGDEIWGKTNRNYIKKDWDDRTKVRKNSKMWFGTHCHPSVIECLPLFEKKINITTMTDTSKYYRFLRACHIYFAEDTSPRTTLVKSIVDDFEPHNECTNIEFSDIVDGTFVKEYNLNVDYFNSWKEHNNFLYKEDPLLIQCFNEGMKNAIQKSY
jgi:hypothetical protein